MRLLVTGPRDWTDSRLVYGALRTFRDRAIAKGDPIEVLIHGAAPGLDSLADAVARGLGLTIESYPANWKRDGRSRAGPIRNRQMRDEGRPTHVLAFHRHTLERLREVGGGTADMVRVAESADLPVYLVRSQEDLGWLASI